LAPEARAQGDDRQGLSRAAGEGRAQAVQGRLLRRHRRCGGRALRVREEGGGRGLRGPRHGGDPPARGGWIPGHRALRLPRRRPLSGRAEDLRQGGCMSVQAATRPRPPIAAPHLRKDAWWALPLTTAIVLGSFIVYSTWAAFQNAHYWAPPYLSPFYSPCLSAKCLHVTFGYGLPEVQLPIIGLLSPAFLILAGPGLFRLTCYYYRKAYYRSFWLTPPACAVPDLKHGYSGETKFPLILQAFHRYTWYLAVLFIVMLTSDALLAFRFPNGFGIGVGTLVMCINVVLLAGYTF